MGTERKSWHWVTDVSVMGGVGMSWSMEFNIAATRDGKFYIANKGEEPWEEEYETAEGLISAWAFHVQVYQVKWRDLRSTIDGVKSFKPLAAAMDHIPDKPRFVRCIDEGLHSTEPQFGWSAPEGVMGMWDYSITVMKVGEWYIMRNTGWFEYSIKSFEDSDEAIKALKDEKAEDLGAGAEWFENRDNVDGLPDYAEKFAEEMDGELIIHKLKTDENLAMYMHEQDNLPKEYNE